MELPGSGLVWHTDGQEHETPEIGTDYAVLFSVCNGNCIVIWIEWEEFDALGSGAQTRIRDAALGEAARKFAESERKSYARTPFDQPIISAYGVVRRAPGHELLEFLVQNRLIS